jgi:hypothetical protein
LIRRWITPEILQEFVEAIFLVIALESLLYEANEIDVAGDAWNETASTGDAWIRQRKEPKWAQKSSTKPLPRVTHGFDSTNSS